MAIHKIGNTAILSVETVASFLNEYKTGTFLEDKTITVSGNTLTISSEHAYINITSASGSNLECVKYSSSPGVTKSYTTQGVNASYSYFYGVILCSKGMIVLLATYDGNATYPRRFVSVFSDSNGELACLMPYITGTYSTWITSTLSGYSVCAVNSTEAANVTLTPNLNAQLTSIAPVVAETTDTSVTIPDVYAALHSQQTNDGLAAVTINGVNYITNGTWYIKDE